MRIPWFMALRWVMVGLFVVAAAVQLNDPDSPVWIAYYLGTALLTIFAERLGRAFAWGTMLIGVVTVISILNVDRWSIDSELAREAWGLLICYVWLFVLMQVLRRRP